MREPCGTCGGNGWVCNRGHDPTPTRTALCSTGCIPFETCDSCRRICSVEDAALVDAIKEIERLGLPAVHNPAPDASPWQVGRGPYTGCAEALPLALSAYLAASKGAKE